MESAIEKINAAMIPSEVDSNPLTDKGSGNGLNVNSIFKEDFPVACLMIAVFI